MLTLNIVRASTDGISNQDFRKSQVCEPTNCNLNTPADLNQSATREEIGIDQTSTREEIRIDQTPTQTVWSLIPLYKLAANGGMLYWQIGFDGISNLEMSHGYHDGIIRTDRTEVKLNSTGRNIQEQALLEARQRYRLKYREGYQPAGATTAPMVKAMKGYEYKHNSIKNWPVYTQPKLNGIRMLCQDVAAGRLSMRSWLNNPFNHLTHLEPELRDFFEYLPRYSTLDGELYNHDMDFTTLTSAVKTTKYQHDKLPKVQYWIFDINYEDHLGAPYEKRYELLINALHRYIQDHSPNNDLADIRGLPRTFSIVQAQLARNHEEILMQHDVHVAAGYEGIMIKKISIGIKDERYNGVVSKSRKLQSNFCDSALDPTKLDLVAGINLHDNKAYNETLYKPGKGNHILKYKRFIDEEALIINVTEAEGTEKGAAIFIVQDQRGNQFPVRMRGDFETRRFWFQNPQLVIGKEVTIRYQELSIYGVPRFPVGVTIRDYE
ncbi:ATP-dependent DNA ligase [uncultured virus]|nr:ATP-dependent DNA ligase [uncultured virus]